jgi:putative oxidoreductase
MSSISGPDCLYVQRLFSTFPNSWPGAGLLMLRLAAGFSLLGTRTFLVAFEGGIPLFLRYASLAVAVLILLGLATPVACLLDAAIQIGILVLDTRYESGPMLAAALGVALAMLGPGAWSVDARMFGRKRIV